MSILSDELTNDPNAVGYSAMTDEQAANSLNAKVIASKKPIPTIEIKRYLMLNGLWLGIKTAGTATSITAIDALDMFDEFRIEDAQVLAVLTSMLDGLVAETQVPNFDATHKADILAMGDTTISRAEQLNISNVTTGQVQAERGA